MANENAGVGSGAMLEAAVAIFARNWPLLLVAGVAQALIAVGQKGLGGACRDDRACHWNGHLFRPCRPTRQTARSLRLNATLDWRAVCPTVLVGTGKGRLDMAIAAHRELKIGAIIDKSLAVLERTVTPALIFF